MQALYPKFSATSIEGKAINLAKPVIERIESKYLAEIKIGKSLLKRDIVCKTTVSKPNKTLLEKGLHFLGLLPHKTETSSLSKNSLGLHEENLANGIIRDVQNANGIFERIINPRKKKHNYRDPREKSLLRNFDEINPSPKTQA